MALVSVCVDPEVFGICSWMGMCVYNRKLFSIFEYLQRHKIYIITVLHPPVITSWEEERENIWLAITLQEGEGLLLLFIFETVVYDQQVL